MVYDPEDSGGVHLFLFHILDDGPGFADYWFTSQSEAVDQARLQYGVEAADWQPISDPPPGCQHDWIAPVRVARDETGRPVYGRFERLPE
jgi:hypothetical protein